MRLGNVKEARSCLNTIINSHGDDEQLVLACVGESIQCGQGLDTARLLQRIIDMQRPPQYAELGELLRFTATTLMRVTASPNPEKQAEDEILARLCAIFRSAIKFRKADPGCSPQLDLAWFQRQSFHVARKHIKSWPRRYIIDLLQYSNELYCADDDLALSDDQRQCTRDSNYLQALLYASEAREVASRYSVEDLPRTAYDARHKPKLSDCRLVLYQQVFRIFSSCYKHHQSSVFADEAQKQDSRAQMQVIIPLAFEALLFMNASSCLTAEAGFDEISIKLLLNNAAELEVPAATSAVLADTVLVFASGDATAWPQLDGLQISSVTAARLLGQVIGMLRKANDYDLGHAARWIRCISQLLLEDVELAVAKHTPGGPLTCNQSLAMLNSVVHQAMDLARSSFSSRAKSTPKDNQRRRSTHPASMYPVEEVQWLAAKLFNMAVDFHTLGQEDLIPSWATTAIELAQMIKSEGGSGGFADMLSAKMQELGWPGRRS